jgi:hypothetical protein
MAIMNAVSGLILSGLLFTSSLEIIFGQIQEKQKGDIPVVTVCEALQDRSLYNGKAIIVVGRFVGTMEGTWLSENCEHKIVTDGYTWDNSISTAYVVSEVEPPPSLPKGFKWDKELLANKLKELQKTTKLQVLKEYNYSDKWVAIFGRFETQSPLVGRFGFGHLNGSPAQLISSVKGYHELKAK